MYQDSLTSKTERPIWLHLFEYFTMQKSFHALKVRMRIGAWPYLVQIIHYEEKLFHAEGTQ